MPRRAHRKLTRPQGWGNVACPDSPVRPTLPPVRTAPDKVAEAVSDPTHQQPSASGEEGGQELDFEQALAELEALVERLESGEQGLEQDLKDFERGIALARQCESRLKAAEQVVQKLVGEPGEEALQPFEKDQGDGERE